MENNNLYTNAQSTLPPPAQPQPIIQPAPAAQPAESKHRLSLPARIGLWAVGIVCGITLLMLCAVAWVFGTNYLRDTAMGEKPPVQQQTPPEHDDGEDFFMLPDGNGGYIPWDGDPDAFNDFFNDYFGNYGGITSGSDEQAEDDAPKAGMGITAQEFVPDIPIEGYSGGLLIAEIREDGAFAGLDVKVNDLIVAFNGHASPTFAELDKVLGLCQPGDNATVTLARYKNGSAEIFDIEITLIDMAALSD